ncbi:hypothetical protein C8R47DRAFT_1068686 [Mycena vitilis]|nr:hypothetical protein C8R47DRAFT_1068686 [Mycena vitilis]
MGIGYQVNLDIGHRTSSLWWLFNVVINWRLWDSAAKEPGIKYRVQSYYIQSTKDLAVTHRHGFGLNSDGRDSGFHELVANRLLITTCGSKAGVESKLKRLKKLAHLANTCRRGFDGSLLFFESRISDAYPSPRTVHERLYSVRKNILGNKAGGIRSYRMWELCAKKEQRELRWLSQLYGDSSDVPRLFLNLADQPHNSCQTTNLALHHCQGTNTFPRRVALCLRTGKISQGMSDLAMRRNDDLGIETQSGIEVSW